MVAWRFIWVEKTSMYVFMEILHISVSALLVSLFDAFFFFFPPVCNNKLDKTPSLLSGLLMSEEYTIGIGCSLMWEMSVCSTHNEHGTYSLHDCSKSTRQGICRKRREHILIMLSVGHHLCPLKKFFFGTDILGHKLFLMWMQSCKGCKLDLREGFSKPSAFGIGIWCSKGLYMALEYMWATNRDMLKN